MGRDEYAHVHVISTATMGAYQPARRQVLTARAALLLRSPSPPLRRPERAYVAFHTWRPGWLALDDADAAALCARAGGWTTDDPPGDHPVTIELRARGWLDAGPPDLDAITGRALDEFPALQNPWELRRLLDVVAARCPRVIVEIGTAAGGLFYALAAVARDDAMLCSIDRFDTPTEHAVCDVLPALARRGQEVHVLRGSSHARAIRDELSRRLAGRAIDLLVIDGDHTYGGTRADVEAYAPLVDGGGLVALHDVAVVPGNSGPGFETGLYWQELAATRPHEVLLDPDGVPGLRGQLHLPPAARRRAAFGFGLVAPPPPDDTVRIKGKDRKNRTAFGVASGSPVEAARWQVVRSGGTKRDVAQAACSRRAPPRRPVSSSSA